MDTVEWLRPVQLQFGGKGAVFHGAPDQRAYRLTNVPDGFDIYDITDPAAPVRLQLPVGSAFEDGLPGQSYLLTGGGTVFTPQVEPFTPPSLPTGDVLYIAPAMLHAALTPLVDLRRAQGVPCGSGRCAAYFMMVGVTVRLILVQSAPSCNGRAPRP